MTSQLRFLLLILTTLLIITCTPMTRDGNINVIGLDESDAPMTFRTNYRQIDRTDSFSAQIFSHSFPETVPDTATGRFYTPAIRYTSIPVEAKYRHVLNFQISQFIPPRRDALATHGPLILFSDDREVIVFSPLNHFFIGLIDFQNGNIQYGIEGEVREVPAGFTHDFLLVKGKGIRATIDYWGEQMRQYAGKKRIDRYADVGLSTLGYWTDAGAAYYWNTEEGMNYEQTLLAVKKRADEQGIPFRYFQIDSWWYYNQPGWPVRRGMQLWEPRPEVFPEGLTAFREKLGLPLFAHTRWFAPDNEYAKRFPFVIEEKKALPLDRQTYDHILDNAVTWGIEIYEPDWLANQYWDIEYLRNDVGHAERWMRDLDDAAADHGLTMQMCMPGAAHLMDSIYRKSWTTVRSSIDYRPSVSKESYWPLFHTTNLLVYALGLWPFKDNFRTAERCGEAEALISTLSAGMVGPSDFLDEMNAEMLLHTCRSDGTLLKPDRPAYPIDAMFFDHQRPYITTTHSRFESVGEWTYVAAYLQAAKHPERRFSDRSWAFFTYDGIDMNRYFAFPDHVNDWHVDLHLDLEITEPRVLFNWRTREAYIVEDRFDLPHIERLYDFDYLVLAPVFANGLALLGEVGKFVTMADKRFAKIELGEESIELSLVGSPGEAVALLAFDVRNGKMLPSFETTIDNDGKATIIIHRSE